MRAADLLHAHPDARRRPGGSALACRARPCLRAAQRARRHASAACPAIVVTLGTLVALPRPQQPWAGGKQISADQVPQAWLDLTSAKLARRARRGPDRARDVLLVIAFVLALAAGRARALRHRLEPRRRRADRHPRRAGACSAPSPAPGLLAGFDGAPVGLALRHHRCARRASASSSPSSRRWSSAASPSAAAPAPCSAWRSARSRCSSSATA